MISSELVGRVLRRARKGSAVSRGSLMVDTVVALGTFAVVGTAVLTGLSVTHGSGVRTASQSVAENLARNQMETTFSQPYQAPPSMYPAVGTPQGYSVTTYAQEYVAGDPNIEEVVVTGVFDGRAILGLETLRVNN